MSIDPSPWAEGNYEEEPGPTSELLKLREQEREEKSKDEAMNHGLWQRYAHRLTKDGTLVR